MTPLRVFRALPTLLALGVAFAVSAPALADEPVRAVVYKSPTCGCCTAWARHLERAGFVVELRDVPDVTPVKARAGVPAALGACHTAFVGGYVIEGHVPAADVRRLLAESPPVVGLAVPGMPEGSPGMEGPNPEPYRVLAFDGRGHVEVFASHGP